MKMVKSLILGSAAGLVAMSGAQAADLPVKAKAVEYVRICSLYGAGFYYIPGTDTCIKLGGYLRVDTDVQRFGVYDVSRRGPALPARQPVPQLLTSPVPVRTSTSIPAPPPNTVSFVPSSMRRSTGRPAATLRHAIDPALARRNSLRRSASTTPSSSSLASPWVRLSRQFSTPWTGYPGNNSLVPDRWSGRRHRRQPVGLHRLVR